MPHADQLDPTHPVETFVGNERVASHTTLPRLGRLPAKASTRALFLNRFSALDATPPAATNFWPRRKAFPLRSFGNLQWGDCTRAKQAIAAMRMERIEQHRTIKIADEEIIKVYQEMSDRLYGGGDNGAYETDALDCWRRPEYTFKDMGTANSPPRYLTIDAYLRLNPFDHDEMKRGLALAGAHGLAVCLNLPLGFAYIEPPNDWDYPAGTPLTGQWMPGSWGGHSMWARDYDEVGIWLVHTWDIPDQRITWRAAAAYLDEAHLVIDSFNWWRNAKPKMLDFPGVKEAVNRVSSVKIP